MVKEKVNGIMKLNRATKAAVMELEKDHRRRL